MEKSNVSVISPLLILYSMLSNVRFISTGCKENEELLKKLGLDNILPGGHRMISVVKSMFSPLVHTMAWMTCVNSCITNPTHNDLVYDHIWPRGQGYVTNFVMY